MRKPLALFVLAALGAFAHASAWAATYTYTGLNYSSPTHDFTAPCAAGTCQNFTTAMRQTGSITTNQPLPPNLNDASVTSFIASYAFDDGVTQYTSSGMSERLMYAHVTTDAAGNITASRILVVRWKTANHLVGERLDYVLIRTDDSISVSNEMCTSMSSGICTGSAQDTATSFALPAGNGAWVSSAPAAVQAVPVNNPFALLLTATGLLGLALRSRRTRGLKA